MKLAKYALCGAMILGASSAHAVPANGSFGGVQLGAINTNGTGTPGTLGVGTTSIEFGVAIGEQIISNIADPYQGNPNNMTLASGTGSISNGDPFTTSISSFAIANGAVNFTLTVDSYTFTFTNALVTSKVLGNIGLYFSGELTSDVLGVMDTPAAASFSATFTQSAPGGSISAAYSLNTPPAPPPVVPEPASLALFAAGIAAFGAARRKSV